MHLTPRLTPRQSAQAARHTQSAYLAMAQCGSARTGRVVPPFHGMPPVYPTTRTGRPALLRVMQRAGKSQSQIRPARRACKCLRDRDGVPHICPHTQTAGAITTLARANVGQSSTAGLAWDWFVQRMPVRSSRRDRGRSGSRPVAPPPVECQPISVFVRVALRSRPAYFNHVDRMDLPQRGSNRSAIPFHTARAHLV